MKIFVIVFCFLATQTFAARQYFTFKPGQSINSLLITNLRSSELARLNSFRLAHRVGKLTHNITLETAAQIYAKILCQTKKLQHSPAANAGEFGQNLYTLSGHPSIRYAPGAATQSWQKEENNYNYVTGRAINSRKPIGHFTAQMWKKVTSVGFGYCTTTRKYVLPSGKSIDLAVMYVVANYYPTPNFVGQYTQNVFPRT